MLKNDLPQIAQIPQMIFGLDGKTGNLPQITRISLMIFGLESENETDYLPLISEISRILC